MHFLHSNIQEAVTKALTEDRARDDVTTEALVRSELVGRAVIISKAHGVLAGIDTAKETFRQVDSSISFVAQKKDTAVLTPDTSIDSNLIAKVNGSLASIITAERTALNFLQHLSGIASTTNKYVQAIQDHNCTILDTRKTTPGLRELQKYAVSVGGGKNHRKDLSDGVLIKDVTLVSTSFTEVSHKLGRKPAGYIVVRKSAAQTVFEDAGDYNNRQLFLRLKSSGAVTVNLWIF